MYMLTNIWPDIPSWTQKDPYMIFSDGEWEGFEFDRFSSREVRLDH